MSVDTSPLGLVADLHRRQGEMYAGDTVPLDGELFDRIWSPG